MNSLATIELVASNWKTFHKNTLQGFIDLEVVDAGVVIRSVCCHRKGDARWISLPAKPWTDQDGKQQWAPIVEFAHNEAKSAFQAAALKAIEELKLKKTA